MDSAVTQAHEFLDQGIRRQFRQVFQEIPCGPATNATVTDAESGRMHEQAEGIVTLHPAKVRRLREGDERHLVDHAAGADLLLHRGGECGQGLMLPEIVRVGRYVCVGRLIPDPEGQGQPADSPGQPAGPNREARRKQAIEQNGEGREGEEANEDADAIVAANLRTDEVVEQGPDAADDGQGQPAPDEDAQVGQPAIRSDALGFRMRTLKQAARRPIVARNPRLA